MKRKLRILIYSFPMLAVCGMSAAQADVYTNEQGQKVECNKESTTTASEGGHPVLGTLAGGAVGGLAGHQFGKGSGNTAMTAAGAVGGAMVGHRLSERKKETTTEQERCHPVEGQ